MTFGGLPLQTIVELSTQDVDLQSPMAEKFSQDILRSDCTAVEV